MLLLRERGAAPEGLCTEAERELLLTGEFRLCGSQHGLVYFVLSVARKRKKKGEYEEMNPAAAKHRPDTALSNHPRFRVGLLARAQLLLLLCPCLSSSFTWLMKL